MEVLTLRYSWKNIIGYLLFAAILLIIMGIASDKQPIGAFIPLALIIVFIGLISTTLRRLSNVYTITKELVTWQNGIISKNVTEIQPQNIRNINIKQGPIQRILKTGHVQIATAGTSGYEVIIKGVNNPYAIKSLIQEKSIPKS